MPIFVVSKISTFSNLFAIEAENYQSAVDIAYGLDSEPEFAQNFLGEEHDNSESGKSLTEEEYVKLFYKENDYLKNSSVDPLKYIIKQ